MYVKNLSEWQVGVIEMFEFSPDLKIIGFFENSMCLRDLEPMKGHIVPKHKTKHVVVFFFLETCTFLDSGLGQFQKIKIQSIQSWLILN